MSQEPSYLKPLKDHFNFDSLRHGQAEVIERVLDNVSCAAIFPTGSGKSLCYQLPAVLLPHLTLVVSPLLALMKDQIDFLLTKNIPAASINSGQSYEESQQVLHDVRSGTIKILMISVERFKNERFRQFIAQVSISLMVVDEAHCISEWGHNFRPDYLKLPHYRKALGIPQVLLLTATATPEVIKDMGEKFAMAEKDIVVTGFYRSNLDLRVVTADDNNKLSKLYHVLGDHKDQPAIVYVTLQQTAESVAASLNRHGFRAQAYHAGMNSDHRQTIQHDFMNGHCDCIVATIAFGMGIDKSNIRQVIHFDLPKSIESYSQEIGRAGRDGELAWCTVIANKVGLNVLENFVYGDTPDLGAIAFVLDELKNHSGTWEVVLSRLSKDSNIRLLPLKTFLVYLEIHNIIESQYSYFAEYRFKCNLEPERIASQFGGERRQFVEHVFSSSTKARTWYSVDFDRLWTDHQAERSRIVSALDYFSEKGWIVLESKQMTEVYRIVHNIYNVQQQASLFFSLFEQKEHSEIQRIHSMIHFFENKRCLSSELAHYFADHQAPERCGHCSVCRGKHAKLPKATPLPDISIQQIQSWCDPFIAANKIRPSTPALTRFLVGMASPLNTRLHARKMAGFGQLEAHPFSEVRRLVNETYAHDN